MPSIVGGLGLSIAEAQKAFNLDYLNNLERLLGLVKSLMDAKDSGDKAVDLGETQKFVSDMLTQLAPSRYQFTETTLKVKMDLSQTMDLGGSAGFGAALGAVAINAAMTVGYGYDYRAAAEVQTVLHAIPASEQTMGTLLARAKEISDKALTLPAGAQVDKDLIDKSHELVSKMLGTDTKAPETPVEQPPATE